MLTEMLMVIWDMAKTTEETMTMIAPLGVMMVRWTLKSRCERRFVRKPCPRAALGSHCGAKCERVRALLAI
jgi:hypothetical protein